MRYTPFDEYRAWPEVGSTAMKQLALSNDPEQFKHGIMPASTATLRAGTLFHSAVLEPEILDSMMIMPEMSYRGATKQAAAIAWAEDKFGHTARSIPQGEGRANLIREEQRRLATLAGVSIVSVSERQMATDMAMSVQRSVRARRILTGATKEMSYRAMGLKTRPDATNGAIWCDIKQSAKRPGQHDAENIIEQLGYGILAAHSEHVLQRAAPVLPDIEAWIWIMVSPKPYIKIGDANIHRVEIYEAGPDIMKNSRELFARALDTYHECTASGKWPRTPEPENATIISRPYWAIKED